MPRSKSTKRRNDERGSFSRRILGVDPGFERIGIAVIAASGKETLLYSDCFRTSPKDPFSLRLLSIGREVGRVMERYKPDALAIEPVLFNTNQKTVMRVSEARGVIIYEASSRGISIFEYTPLQVKIAVTGYGHATKEQITAMVPKLIALKGNKKRLDDEYDAIAIGITHAATCRGSTLQ